MVARGQADGLRQLFLNPRVRVQRIRKAFGSPDGGGGVPSVGPMGRAIGVDGGGFGEGGAFDDDVDDGGGGYGWAAPSLLAPRSLHSRVVGPRLLLAMRSRRLMWWVCRTEPWWCCAANALVPPSLLRVPRFRLRRRAF